MRVTMQWSTVLDYFKLLDKYQFEYTQRVKPDGSSVTFKQFSAFLRLKGQKSTMYKLESVDTPVEFTDLMYKRYIGGNVIDLILDGYQAKTLHDKICKALEYVWMQDIIELKASEILSLFCKRYLDFVLYNREDNVEFIDEVITFNEKTSYKMVKAIYDLNKEILSW